MFCGQCGKRVLDTMLFCPFCGSPIVIPDQEEGEANPAVPAEPVEQQPAEAAEPEALFEVEEPETEEAPEPEELPEAEPEAAEEFEPLRFDAPEKAGVDEPDPAIRPDFKELERIPERPASLFDDLPGEEEVFAPLDLDAPEQEVSDPIPPMDLQDGPLPSGDIIPLEDPPRPSSPARRRPEGGASRRSNQTFIPVKNVDLDDMFMDNSHPEPEDEYDPYDDDGDDDFGDDFDFEEPERGGFLQRHIRGVVGLILLAVLLIIFLIWIIMPKGQQVLATANLAWSAETYNNMGYESYESGQFHQAATYFERALARDEGNYEYAHSAMVAYYEAEEIDSALSMLKKCIEMRPDDPEPYHEMLILYPNASERPWEVQELLRLGYERTGDETLNINTAGE